MAIQRTVKTYPLLKWLLLVSAAVVAFGLFSTKVVTDPDDADTKMFVYYVVGAALLPFLALLMPRHKRIVLELPTDQLEKTSRQDLQGILEQLERAHAKGEIPDERYQKARERILKQVGQKGK